MELNPDPSDSVAWSNFYFYLLLDIRGLLLPMHKEMLDLNASYVQSAV